MAQPDADTLLDFLAARQSTKADLLAEPAPDTAELERLLGPAMSVPDHGAIRPWRFVTIRGAARERLSDVFEDALRAREPEAGAEDIANIRGKPLRAPLLVAVGAEIVPDHPKVPPAEQLVSAGCAAHALLLAAHAAGWGAILLTGWPAHDARVRAALGFAEKDRLVGFVYMGTAPEGPRDKKRPAPGRFLSDWTGPAA